LSRGNRPGSNRRRKPKRSPGDSYDVASYRRAIHRACEVADRQAHRDHPDVAAEQKLVPIWGPHRLRHTAATEIRRRFGIEAAANVLGHSDSFVTLVYAEADLAKAAAVMREVG
jgi:integrase